MEIIFNEEQLQEIKDFISCELSSLMINSLNAQEPMLLNKKEICTYLNISNNTLDEWIKQGLPKIRVGRILRFSVTEVNTWLKNH